MANKKERILRRMSFLYTEGGKTVNLLTIVEQMEPDMPDYIFSPKKIVACQKESFRIEVNDYNHYDGWQDDTRKVCKQFGDDDHKSYKREPKSEHHLVLSREFDDTKLTEILPFRKGPYYLICYQKPNDQAKELIKNEELRRRISAISEKRLGYDICKYNQWLGGIYMVWHHPVIKDIHFTGTDSPAGLLCSIIVRQPDDISLLFRVIDHDKDGKRIGKVAEQKVRVNEGKFLLRTHQPVTRPDVEVWDDAGELVYSIKGIVFIKRIVLNMGVMDGVTGEKELVKEREVVTSESSNGLATAGKKRADLTNKIITLLKDLPQEEVELVLDEVKRQIEA